MPSETDVAAKAISGWDWVWISLGEVKYLEQLYMLLMIGASSVKVYL